MTEERKKEMEVLTKEMQDSLAGQPVEPAIVTLRFEGKDAVLWRMCKFAVNNQGLGDNILEETCKSEITRLLASLMLKAMVNSI